MEFNNGYIKLYRSLLNWEWWGSVKTRDVFIYILLAANWEDNRWQGVLVKRGQLLRSVSNIAKAVGITEKSVRVALEHLKMTNEVTIETANGRTLITIVNYEKYQAVEEKGASEGAKETASEGQTRGKRGATNEESKNVNNNNNNKYIGRFSPPSVEEVRAYCLERQNNVDPQHFIDHYQSNGWKVGKNPMKDWKASVRNWEKNSMSTPKIDNKPKKYTRPEDYL